MAGRFWGRGDLSGCERQEQGDGEVLVSEVPSPELRFYPTLLYPEGLLLRELRLEEER